MCVVVCTHSHAHTQSWMINKGGTRRTRWKSDDIPNNEEMSGCREGVCVCVCVGLRGDVIALDCLLGLIAVVAMRYDAATAVH